MNETGKPSRRGGFRPGAGRKAGQGPYGEPTVALRIPQSQADSVRAWLGALRQPGALAVGSGLDWLGPAESDPPRLPRPVFLSKVAAGFPSPADDHVEDRVDLNTHLVRHPAATFFLRVKGQSMTGAGIFDGDLLVVDRALDATHGSVVIAVVDGELTVKRLARLADGGVELRPEHPDYPVIRIGEFQTLDIWGVVTNVIHSLRP